MTHQIFNRPKATLVPDERRPEFLPTLFGHRLLIVAENTVYSMMERLSPQDYGGGHWDFFEDDSQPLFLAPTSRPRFRIQGDITCFQGDVSAEAAGIIATLFAFSHLSFRFQSDHLADGYERLIAMSMVIPRRRKSTRPSTDPAKASQCHGALSVAGHSGGQMKRERRAGSAVMGDGAGEWPCRPSWRSRDERSNPLPSRFAYQGCAHRRSSCRRRQISAADIVPGRSSLSCG